MGGQAAQVTTSDPLGLLDVTYSELLEGEGQESIDTAARQQGLGNSVVTEIGGTGAGFSTAQQGIGNAALTARGTDTGTDESSVTQTDATESTDAATDTSGAKDAVRLLGTDYSTGGTLVSESVTGTDSITSTESDAGAGGGNTTSAGGDSGSGEKEVAGGALASFEEAAGGGEGDGAGAGAGAVASQLGGTGDLKGLLPLPALPRSSRPIPANANNAGVLTQIVQSNAALLRQGIAASAKRAALAAVMHGSKISAAIDASALAAIAQVRADADSTMATIDTETTACLGQVGEQHDGCAMLFDAMIDDALLAFEAAYVIESDNVAAAIEAKALAILAYGAARAAAVRASVQARADKARELRDEAYAPYRTHEDADDVWEALAGACDEAVRRFADGAEETAKGIESFARDAAATWRSEVPPNNAELSAVWQRSNDALEAERDKLKSDLSDKTSLLEEGLAQSVTDAGIEIEATVTAFDTAVEEARLDAQQDLIVALDAHLQDIETAADDTVDELAMLEEAMLGEIDALDTESGGIFDPEDARPALDRIFGTISAAWTSRATGAQADFASLSDDAAASFERRVAEAGTTATASFTEQADAFTTVADAFLADIAQVQADAVALAQGQVDTVSAQVGIDLSETALTITDALETAYKTTAENIDQTEYKMTATHNGAVYKLRSVYQDTITEALKSWYEKLWDWVIDAISAFFGAVADFFVWLGKSIVNLVWGFIWGETAFPEAWGAGVIAFIGDLVAGVLVFGDIRDIFKWGFWKPVVMGEEWTWLNGMMIGLGLFGIVPIWGDVAKAVGKGAKALMKDLGERIARELLEEFAERGGTEIVERLVKDLGAETVKGLTEKLGAKGFRELIETFGEKGVKDLVTEIGAEATSKLAKEFGAAGLKTVIETFTGPVLRDLAAEIGEKVLKETIEALGAAATKELVGVVGAAGLKDLLTQFTAPGLKALLDGATGITAKLLGELTQEFGTKALKELVDAVGVPALRELTDVLGAKALKEMTAEFTPAGMRILLDATTGLGARMAGELTKEFGAKALKELVDAVGAPAVRELTDVLGAAGVKSMTAEFTVAGMRTLLDASTGIAARVAGELFEEIGAKGLKELTAEFGAAGLRALLDETTGLTARIAADLYGGFGAKGLKEYADKFTVPMLRELGTSHKVNAWKVYLERNGDWAYKHWSTIYEQNQVRAINSNTAVAAYQKVLGWGKTQVTAYVQIKGVQVARRLDIASESLLKGIEHKTGYITLDKEIRWEVERDALIVKQLGWSVEWVFEGTASKPLLEALDKAGITYKFWTP